ncbi:MAG: hypothetical protein GXO62_04815 [Epsilonproteobacteria bacterium]|nr:hypothetical protein [Campylobacterota bacterium]
MKKALTLIELIFTMVIIAFTFSVIPRVIYLSNKSLEFSNREDAIFNMMAKMMDLSVKEYDYNNTIYDDILLTGNQNILECNTTTALRIGGFKGSRNCKHKVYESPIPTNTNGEYDYIEGYNGVEENLIYKNKIYTLSITVGYTDEWDDGAYAGDSLNYSFTSNSGSGYSNIKRVYIKLLQGDKTVSSVKYYSSNIGHIQIESVVW